jgi:hypothetical protein
MRGPAALGGHLYRCESCAHEKVVYNSCRDRYCPKCQSLDKEKWLEARSFDHFPVPYYQGIGLDASSTSSFHRPGGRALARGGVGLEAFIDRLRAKRWLEIATRWVYRAT